MYYLDAVTRQLMHYDGFHTVVPVLDEVVGLNFEYYGDPQPPAMVACSRFICPCLVARV